MRLVAMLVLAALPAGGQSGTAATGQRQFESTCAACHGLDGGGSVKGAAIAKLPASIAMSDDELIAIVKNGVLSKGMPPHGRTG